MSTSHRVTPLRGRLDAEIVVPGSRSLTNRALACAALAGGTSHLVGVVHNDDTAAMAGCIATLGAGVEPAGHAELAISGTGGVLAPGPSELHTAISGTTSRFVLALAALGHGEVTVDAGPPMRARPMADAVEALRSMGVEVVELGDAGHLPLRVRGPWRGGSAAIRGDVSSQFLSGLLLAAPASEEGVELTVEGELKSVPYVEMTISVMEAFGATVEVSRDPWRLRVAPTGYRPTRYLIEPDASSAAYFLTAPLVVGGRVRVPGLGSGSVQGDARFVEVLASMGAEADVTSEYLEVRADTPCHGVDVDLSDMSDQASTLAVAAAFAEGPTEVSGVGFIRRKESDRIAVVVEGLGRLGVGCEELPDGFRVHGVGDRRGEMHSGVIATHDDHRIAMSFALAGLAIPGVEIVDPLCVAKTYPRFFDDLASLEVH